MTVEEALTKALADLDGATASRTVDGRTEWLVGGRLFATLRGDGTAEFLLEPRIAQAALGTPDATPSVRGPGWVTFRPATLDQYAVDRAAAWFGSAYRTASRGSA